MMNETKSPVYKELESVFVAVEEAQQNQDLIDAGLVEKPETINYFEWLKQKRAAGQKVV